MAELDFSILEKVKKRLVDPQDTHDLDSETQVIGDATQIIRRNSKPESASIEAVEEEDAQGFHFGQSLLFSQPTQKIRQPIEPIRLPQLGLEDVEVLNPETASTQKISTVSDAQTKEIEADLTKASLTDEENELDANEAETTVDSSVQKNVTTKAELEEIQRQMSEEKRAKSIKPAFSKRSIDPVKRLVAAFESDSEGEEAKVLSDQQLPKSSPTTSPMKETGMGKVNLSDSDDSDLENSNVLDFISKPPPPKSPTMKIKHNNPVESYALNLKRQILSSPTRQNEDNPSIDLDDSSEEAPDERNSAVPELTKDQRLLIKQKFARKKLENTKKKIFSKFQHLHTTKTPNKLFQELKRANAKQLSELKRENGDAELIEEIEKEEEEMGTLLEREIERVRRIRKKEKLKEKAQQALLTGKVEGNSDEEDDGDYREGSEEEDVVPDSDIDPEESDYGSDDDEEGDDIENSDALSRHPRRVILSDDEDVASQEPQQSTHQTSKVERRHDDSYMFGGHGSGSTPESDEEEEVMHIQSDSTPIPQPSQQFHDIVEEDTKETNSRKLFGNLETRNDDADNSNVSFNQEDSIEKAIEVPSFQDITPSQASVDFTMQTQADVLPSQLTSVTQNDEEYSDGEEDYPTAVSRGRSQVQNKLDTVHESDEEKADEPTEEELQKQLAFFEEKMRRKELKARRKRKEMERKGIKNLLEGEAEESEDEWKGIGGADHEGSDQADSEDERMIDNRFNIDLNDEEIRKKFMEQYQIKDKKELEKLIDDIKNHRLTKRARGNGFDIELSDEEDEMLMAYRRQKLEEQKQRLLENQKLQKLAKNEKAKAFFESIQDEMLSVALDEDSDEEESSPSTQPDENLGDSQATEEDQPDSEPRKRVLHLEESFVQKKLSFLSRNDDDDYMSIQNMSRMQHGIQSDDEVEDMMTLKNRSMMNLFRSETPEVVEDEDRGHKRPIDEVATDEDEDDNSDITLSQVFKKPSVVSSFRSFKEKRGVQVSSRSFSGVTVNKEYKMATGSEASISYISRAAKVKNNTPKMDFKSSRAIRIEEGLKEAKRKNFSSKIFNSKSSFE
ncbi:hypothetical protein CJI97_001135 [Candidozyma auris]|nr:hypothetical protein CJI97_001135 [[Candida] auris]